MNFMKPWDWLVQETDLVEEVPSDSRVEGEKACSVGEPLTTLLKDEEFKRELLSLNVFIFGRVDFFEKILAQIFGDAWRKKEVLVREIAHIEKVVRERNASGDNEQGVLIVIPSVQDEEKLNQLVAEAMKVGAPVWLVGYPSTLRKHLWVNFSGFILCQAPVKEIQALQDILGLTSLDLQILSSESPSQVHGLIVTPKRRAYFS